MEALMSEITVGELIKELEQFNKNDTVCFGPKGHFTFYRTKDHGGEVQIEFNECPDIEYTLSANHSINTKT
jgi:hypothetical protein